jgi:hypothetical protein
MSKPLPPLDRRSFLRGAGVAVALPFLDAMRLSARANGPVREPARRICFVYFPNGASMPEESDTKWNRWRWFPNAAGENYQFTEVLSCLEPYRAQLSLLGGLSHPLSRELLGHLAGDTWLTAGDARGDSYQNRVSADQVAASLLKRHTRLPSLVCSTDGGVGYRSRVSTLSFDHSARPIPSEHLPRRIFERYFSPGGGTPTEERRASLKRGKRIVDLVLDDGKNLSSKLGQADRAKLDQYLQSLRDVEEQVRRNEAWLDRPMKSFDAAHLQLDTKADVDPAGYLRVMYDLLALAFETDLTRVATFMTGREDGMGFAEHFPSRALGIKRGHHTISHDTHEGHWEEWGRYDQWHAQQFAHFLKRLAETRDDDGPLLDRTLVLYGSCCSTTHNARNYPLALVGGGALGVRHGRYTKYDESTPFSNVLLGMLRTMGVPAESFADSTGWLPEVFGA